ncbi:hypothetical protein K9L67_01085 [Candidatus Woesearchaeota archaeon]|nr:hypothetical protein [Candidatus Woesearchaeota archaeon]MCF7900798.1 hypothetical protein [Candidatus Woesearchaeota archaeon]MCF8013100.1 hypothetical protein [Candidatus Woesearchaeota archaeon]
MNLVEWTVAYIKYKDTVFRRIESLKEDSDKIIVNLKSGHKQIHLCADYLDKLNIDNLSNEKISCLNVKKNLDWLISNWNLIISKDLVFHFVNLDKSESWSINPKMHHSISEKGAIKTGLQSLFDSVPQMR